MHVKELLRLQADPEAAGSYITNNGFVHFTNADRLTFEFGRASLWEPEKKDFGFVYSGPFLVGPPKETHAFSSQELTRMGSIGIYRRPEDKNFDAYDPAMFGFLGLKDALAQAAARQSMTWGWSELGAADVKSLIRQSHEKWLSEKLDLLQK